MDRTGNKRFFSFADRAAFWTGTLVSFLVYFATCAPSVTLEDCGELAVAGDYAGVPHPPGYPSWTMCAWVFARLLSWVTFRGQPNPAWAIAVMSAFWGALATGLMAMLVSRTAADMLKFRRGAAPAAAPLPGRGFLASLAGSENFEDVAGFVSGCSSSLVFAFAPVMWSQCTIVEVYSFNAFFLMLLLLLAYKWMCRQGDRLLVATAFLFGLGLTNYQVLLLALVPLVLAILLQDIHLFRDFVLAAIPFGLTAGIMKLGALAPAPGFPKHDPLDPGCPVVGAVVDPGWYWAVAVFVAVFLAATGVRGWIAVSEKRGGAPAWADDAKLPLALVAAVSGAAALVACLCVPAASDPYASRLAQISAAYLSEGKPDPVFRWGLPAAAFLAGLAALWVFALFTPGGLWYAAAATGFELPLAILLRKGALLGLTHPLSGYFAAYAALDVAVLALAWFLLERGRVVALSFAAAQAGAAFYAFMPVAGDVCPPMNWGYPRTWEGFKHALSRGQYEKISPTSMFSPLFIHQIGDYFTDVRMQFTLVLAPFGVLPFAAWKIRRRGGRTFDLLPWAAAAAAAVAGLVAADRASAGIDLAGRRVDKVLFLALLLAGAVGLHAVAAKCVAPLFRTAASRAADRSARLVSGLSGAAAVVAVVGFAGGFVNAVAEFALETALRGAFGADFAPETWRFWGAADFALTAAAFGAYLAGAFALLLREFRGRPVVDPAVADIGARWHAVVFSCFLMMSVVLIALANPNGDVQDSFIQKVKFIASHGLYALWIGYGAALAVSTLRRRPALAGAACALALAAPLVPVHENYFNFHLADVTSGADQNGHDFGWQFGNYQLRGAAAIGEELSRDEEPLPNPFFPPAMDENAVFFGGTDPGRFVPTYMIYSAHVRPDVYLITQNALADNTYLDTMRGLYADDIWMPTTDDNRVAFAEYTDDVRAGRRPDLGGISVDSQGRVSVNGAYSVMEINGILCKQIFDRNRDAHSFYVEESYAIPWMYPHLKPNGLVMKICRDPEGWSARTVEDDMDFWDWYSRRLLADPRFGRDFPARKAFNKLRSSIAGAYANRGDLDNAERAFRQAHSLFVYSPETAMRLSREVLLPRRRFDDAVAVFEQLSGLDPNNRNLPLSELRSMRDADARVRGLSPRLRMGAPLSDGELLVLLRDALAIGAAQTASQALGALLERPDAAPETVFGAGMCIAEAGHKAEASPIFASLRPDFLAGRSVAELRAVADCHVAARDPRAAAPVLSAILRQDRSDWETWLEYAVALSGTGDNARAAQALAYALRTGGTEARAALAHLPAAMVDAVRPLLAPPSRGQDSASAQRSGTEPD